MPPSVDGSLEKGIDPDQKPIEPNELRFSCTIGVVQSNGGQTMRRTFKETEQLPDAALSLPPRPMTIDREHPIYGVAIMPAVPTGDSHRRIEVGEGGSVPVDVSKTNA